MSATWNSGRLRHEHHDPVAGPDARGPRRPAAARATRSAYSAKVSDADVVALLSPERHVGAPLGHGARGTGLGSCRASSAHGRHVIHTGWRTAVESGKLRRDGEYWRQFVPRRSLGRRHVRASLRRLSSGRTRARARSSALNATDGSADRRACSAHAQLVAGVLVSVFLVPASAARRPGVVDHHLVDDVHHRSPVEHLDEHPEPRRVTDDPEARSGRLRRPRQPGEPEPGDARPADRAGRPGDPASGRARRRDRRQRSRSSTPTRAELERMRQIVRDRAAYIYRHADHPAPRSPTSSTSQDIARARSTRSRRRRPTNGKVDGLAEGGGPARRAARGARAVARVAAAGEGPAREREGRRSRR